ncbi:MULTISPECIES: macrolide 2'-phosphotransferase MphL [Bacillus]|uniref:Putative macrolide 2-phosphotransferase n=1 Tax=Bacillus cereus TaxID=1396 RepID=A0A164KY81_BACCE|nr:MULTISPECIES: macrolide 2'-phosphotransferase MphL [Bacillus]KZD51851.1 putative macrolide 2-phosphotransferase [Bacillus cereus]MDG1618139.1 macrolide 2'-phosphotransferase MphL [Bacillus mobilis]MDX5839944.1 macrolide 2'-phosphotransferase MphL [Bacillus cereus group sp. BfR-BA-01700]MED4388160.1 macrolide 2'-phosphotransferase MphL [Bacillus mobilis]NEL00970.1 Mph(B) family macrolide 2'-phosphotransferase [Bacillus mobilis]
MNTLKVKQLATKEGLNILEDSIEINESGVDFQVAHVKEQNGDKWILRIPRRRESMRHALLEKEALEIMKQHAEFQVPDWSIFSEELIAYKQLSGVPAATIDIERQEYVWNFNEKNAPTEYNISLGKVLANLHSLPQQKFNNIGVEMLTANELRTSMKQRMNRVKEQYDINQNLWDRWQAWLAEDSFWPSHVGVKHGDIHPGHILIDNKNNVTGLIDWTEVGVGDVSIDFTSHYLLFGKDGLTNLIHSYDNAGGKTWSRMDEHIIELLATSGITVAEYAQVSGLKDMHEIAVHMLATES